MENRLGEFLNAGRDTWNQFFTIEKRKKTTTIMKQFSKPRQRERWSQLGAFKIFYQLASGRWSTGKSDEGT